MVKENTERGSHQKNEPYSSRDFGTRERRDMRFLRTGLFGELEHRQGLRAIKRVCVGECKVNREI